MDVEGKVSRQCQQMGTVAEAGGLDQRWRRGIWGEEYLSMRKRKEDRRERRREKEVK